MSVLRASCILVLVTSSAGWARASEANSPRPNSTQAAANTIRIPLGGAYVSGGALVAIVRTFGVVTSDLRTIAHNRRVGGVANSYHLRGQAIDVARKVGVTHLQIQHALTRAGYRLIESLDEGDHSHFAFAQDETVRASSLALPIVNEPGPPMDEAKSAGRSVPPLLIADNHGTLEATGFVIQRPGRAWLQASTASSSWTAAGSSTKVPASASPRRPVSSAASSSAGSRPDDRR